MAEVTVSFCSPIDEHGALYGALDDLLGVYYESERVEEAEFRRPEAGDDDRCTAVHIDVEDPFRDQLREDVADTIREHHDCDVVVGEYEGEAGPDFVHGNCHVD